MVKRVPSPKKRVAMAKMRIAKLTAKGYRLNPKANTSAAYKYSLKGSAEILKAITSTQAFKQGDRAFKKGSK